jgi:alpha-mannosidase
MQLQMIHYVNKDGRVNAFYSTPSRYLAAKRATPGLQLPLKTDDFFPYSGNKNGTDYWTGFFSSRPILKAQVRYQTGFADNNFRDKHVHH